MSLLWAKVAAEVPYHGTYPNTVPPSRLRLRSSKDDTLSDRVSKMPENIAVTKAGYAGRVHPYKDGLMDTGFIQPENYDDGEDHDAARKRYHPVDDTPDLYKFIRATPYAGHIWGKIEPSEVDLTQPIHATQPFVHKSHVQRYLDNPEDQIHDDKQPGQKVADDYPFKNHPGFVKYRGRMHVIDGHHRVASELMKGSPSITGKVYDADKHGLPLVKTATHDGWGEEDPGPPR